MGPKMTDRRLLAAATLALAVAASGATAETYIMRFKNPQDRSTPATNPGAGTENGPSQPPETAAEPLEIAATPPSALEVGEAVSFTITAKGGTPPYRFSAQGLPSGVSVDEASGAVSGAPTSAGSSSPSLSVKDSKDEEVSLQAFTLSVAPNVPRVAGNGLPALTTDGTQGYLMPGSKQLFAMYAGFNASSIRITGSQTVEYALDADRIGTSLVYGGTFWTGGFAVDAMVDGQWKQVGTPAAGASVTGGTLELEPTISRRWRLRATTGSVTFTQARLDGEDVLAQPTFSLPTEDTYVLGGADGRSDIAVAFAAARLTGTYPATATSFTMTSSDTGFIGNAQLALNGNVLTIPASARAKLITKSFVTVRGFTADGAYGAKTVGVLPPASDGQYALRANGPAAGGATVGSSDLKTVLTDGLDATYLAGRWTVNVTNPQARSKAAMLLRVGNKAVAGGYSMFVNVFAKKADGSWAPAGSNSLSLTSARTIPVQLAVPLTVTDATEFYVDAYAAKTYYTPESLADAEALKIFEARME